MPDYRMPFGRWKMDDTCKVSYCECPCNGDPNLPEYDPKVQHDDHATGCWVNREDEATAMSGEVPCRTLCYACVGNRHDYTMLDNVL